MADTNEIYTILHTLFKKINTNSWVLFPKYVNVMNQYILHFTNSAKFKKGEEDAIYLLLNGFTTLSHVFKTLLRTSLDVDKAIENTQHAIYYYTQCIEQIEESKMDDLNSSYNVAAIFVYKKTIGDIFINPMPVPPGELEIIKNIEELIFIWSKSVELLIGNKYQESVPAQLTKLATEICLNQTSERDFQKKIMKLKTTILSVSVSNIYEHLSL
jgi:hypothetical protein